MGEQWETSTRVLFGAVGYNDSSQAGFDEESTMKRRLDAILSKCRCNVALMRLF